MLGSLGLSKINQLSFADVIALVADSEEKLRKKVESENSSSGSSSRTERWVHFQQNAGLRRFVHR